MKFLKTIAAAALLAGLGACVAGCGDQNPPEPTPVVVNQAPPAHNTTVVVPSGTPGPAGPAGAPGAPGAPGAAGPAAPAAPAAPAPSGSSTP